MSLENSVPVIRLKGVSNFYSDKQVLKDVNVDINAGEIIGYLGANGAGKTTTVKILTGMLTDFEGSAEILGKDIKKHSLAVKQRIGYVPEVAALYEQLSPIEFLLFVGRIYGLSEEKIKVRAIEMLKALGLEREAHSPMKSFSKGMKQKVLIIAGIIHDPEILFLDEPFSGLDANSIALVKEIITKLSLKGKTIFYCSHLMDVVERICDRIIILSNGVVVADGTMLELQENEGGETLQEIFSQITNRNNLVEVADEFVAVLNS